MPEVDGDIFVNSAAVSFEVVEGDFGYGEDFYLDDDYQEVYSQEEYSKASEENHQEEVEEDSTTGKSIEVDSISRLIRKLCCVILN